MELENTICGNPEECVLDICPVSGVCKFADDIAKRIREKYGDIEILENQYAVLLTENEVLKKAVCTRFGETLTIQLILANEDNNRLRNENNVLKKIKKICDIGSAEFFDDATDRLLMIKKLLTEQEKPENGLNNDNQALIFDLTKKLSEAQVNLTKGYENVKSAIADVKKQLNTAVDISEED